MPALRRLNEVARSANPSSVQLIAVGLESEEVLKNYLTENGLTTIRPLTVTRESEAAAVVARTPTLVLVDRQGRVLTSWTGWMTPQQMDEVIKLHHIGPTSN